MADDAPPYTNENIKRLEDNAKARYQEMLQGIPKASKKEVKRLEERAEPKEVVPLTPGELSRYLTLNHGGMPEASDDQIPRDADEIGQLVAEGTIDVHSREYKELLRTKPWMELTFKEFWSARLNEVFEEDEVRAYRHNTYFDSKVFRTLRVTKRELTSLQPRSVLLYIFVGLGIQRIREAYSSIAAEINKLIDTIDDDQNFKGYIEQTGKLRINQTGGGAVKGKMGFTLADHDVIGEEADYYGVEIESYILAAFWMGALAREDLPEDLKEYGRGIVVQFERHLKMRLAGLKNLHQVYS